MLPQQFGPLTERGVLGLILAGLDAGSNSWVDDIVMRIRSDQAIETYAWLGNAPAMREFIGGRSPKELKENGFTIRNKDYESSIRIQSKDWRRDKTDNVERRVAELVEKTLDLPAILLTNLIMAGTSSLCYDDQYFFDTDHSEGASGTQSNSISVDITAPATPTVEEFASAVVKGVQQVFTFKDDTGSPMNQSASEFQLQVPIQYMGIAHEATTALLGVGGKSNTLPLFKGKFSLDVVPNPRLTWTDKFALFRTDSAAKPFILQEEKLFDGVVFGPGSDFEKLHRECLIGTDWSGNVAYAYWQHAVLVTLT